MSPHRQLTCRDHLNLHWKLSWIQNGHFANTSISLRASPEVYEERKIRNKLTASRVFIFTWIRIIYVLWHRKFVEGSDLYSVVRGNNLPHCSVRLDLRSKMCTVSVFAFPKIFHLSHAHCTKKKLIHAFSRTENRSCVDLSCEKALELKVGKYGLRLASVVAHLKKRAKLFASLNLNVPKENSQTHEVYGYVTVVSSFLTPGVQDDSISFVRMQSQTLNQNHSASLGRPNE